MGNVLVELLVLLFGDFRLGARPQRRGLVDFLVFVLDQVLAFFLVPLLLFHQDGQGDVVGILADDGAQAGSIQQFFLARAQVQRHFRAAARFFRGLDRVVAFAGRLPAHTQFFAQPRS